VQLSSFLQDEVNPMKFQHLSSVQVESVPLSNPLPRPNLIARWDLENGKLVCRWIVDDTVPGTLCDTVPGALRDRPHKPSVH
jgi:hypothetical protein